MRYAFGEFTLDTDVFEIKRDGEALAAEPQVLDLLILLVESREKVVTRDELLAKIWKGRVVSDAALSSRIKSVRRLLDDDGSRQMFIRTIHGKGFRFVGEVVASAARSPGLPLPDNAAAAASSPVANTGTAFPRPQTRYAKSGDVHIAYQLFGDGPVNFVLAPGFVSHIDNYWDHPDVANWLKGLASFARVAMFDKRGTGLSDQVPHLPDMDERMDDVRAVMDAVAFDRAVIMGISEGGSLATLFAATHPDRCQGLVLYGAFAQFSSWFDTEGGLQGLFDYIESAWGSGASLPQFAPTVGDDPAFIEWWGKFERLGANPGAAIALMRMNSKIDLTQILPSVQAPTLVIHNAGDVLINVEGGRFLAKQIPNATYVEWDGIDHLPWVGDTGLKMPGVVRDFVLNVPTSEPVDHVLATVLAIRCATDDGSADHVGELQRIITEYRGGELIWSGHTCLVAFDGPSRALRCAGDIVRCLAELGRAGSVGAHTGEVAIGRESIEGLAVQIADEIAAVARAGEVLVSRTVVDLVAGSGVCFDDAGTRPVAAMPEDWRLYAIAS